MAFSVAALGVGGGNATTAWSTTLTAGAPIGALVLVPCTGNASGTAYTTPSDSRGNTYAAISTVLTGTGDYLGETMLFYSVLTTALLTSDTITATQSVSRTGTMAASAVTGVTWAGSPLDKDAGNAPVGTTTSPSTGATATTTQASELVWAVFAFGNTVTAAAGAGFTADPAGRVDNSVSRYLFSEWLEQTSVQAETASATFGGAGSNYHALIATFKPTVGGGAVVSHQLAATGVGG